jgi:hypothetical protein
MIFSQVLHKAFFVAKFHKIMKIKKGQQKAFVILELLLSFFAKSRPSCGLGNHSNNGWLGSLATQKQWLQSSKLLLCLLNAKPVAILFKLLNVLHHLHCGGLGFHHHQK